MFIISDLHLSHTNIIKYCNRPFKTVEEMNEHIIEKWNSVVSNDDTVCVVGDFYLGDKDKLKEIVSRLNGTKILMKGNHDRFSTKFYIECGFSKVHTRKIVYFYDKDNYTIALSHWPNRIADLTQVKCYSGHTHSYNKLVNEEKRTNHWNINAEALEYIPLKIELSGETVL